MHSGLRMTRPTARRVTRAAVLLHGRAELVSDGLARLESLARRCQVELVVVVGDVAEPPEQVDIAVVLGGDGTMLRALTRFLGTGIPVIGVNFGRVGFLSSISREELEGGLERVFAGDIELFELPTLELEVGREHHVAVNDAVVTSGQLGRMVELEWSVGGEDLGRVPCDGLICSTPSGSTAYNLSNGGPVLMWGLDALALTFVAPHNLHARPLVAPRGQDVLVWNRTQDVPAAVLVDGHAVGEVGPGERAAMRLGPQRSLLATLPEATFVRRYRQSFAAGAP